MESTSRRISKDKKLQCFFTEIPKEEAKVRFESNGASTPVDSFRLIESVPMASLLLNSKSQIRSVEGRRAKASGIGGLRSILKGSREVLSSKRSVNKENREQGAQSQRNNKYCRISINDHEFKQTTENSSRAHHLTASRIEPLKPSINKFLLRTQTEAFQQKDCNPAQAGSARNLKRVPKRRKCRITTQEQFEEECTKYLQEKEREETSELFREVKREMKLHQKRREPNNYYQKIRRSALRKIDYMSYNQKYYDDAEVRHLFSVVENCNILIHKRNEHHTDHPKRLRTERLPNSQDNSNEKEQNQLLTKKESYEDEPLNRTSISAKDLFELTQTKLKDAEVVNKFNTSKTVKITQKEKVNMNKKISNIVQVCERQRKMLEEVKNGMKVFEFYCSKMDTGFASKGRRLNNFIVGEDQS